MARNRRPDPPRRDGGGRVGPGREGFGGKGDDGRRDGHKGGGGKGGDGKGGGKGNKRRKRQQEQQRFYNRAGRDVRLALDPLLEALSREGTLAERQFRTDADRFRDIYGSLDRELQPLTGQFREQMSGVTEDFQGQLGELAQLLGSQVPGVPQSELTAGAGAFGALGAGALGELASARGRNVAYNTSAERQGGIEQAVTHRNALVDLENYLSELSRRRADVQEDIPDLFRQRLDELRDQSWQREMARKEFGLRAAATKSQVGSDKSLNRYLQDAIRSSFGGGGGGGRRNRRGGAGGGGQGGGGGGGDGQGGGIGRRGRRGHPRRRAR